MPSTLTPHTLEGMLLPPGTPSQNTIDALMVEFVRLCQHRDATGDDGEYLGTRIRYAATRLHVARLRRERADLLAQPEFTVERAARLYEIQRELLSPDIDLPEHRAAALTARARWLNTSTGRAVDIAPKLPELLSPRAAPGHIHWVMEHPGTR